MRLGATQTTSITGRLFPVPIDVSQWRNLTLLLFQLNKPNLTESSQAMLHALRFRRYGAGNADSDRRGGVGPSGSGGQYWPGVARMRAGWPLHAHATPPIGRISSGPHSSKHTTADRAGQLQYKRRISFFYCRSAGHASVSRCECAARSNPLGAAVDVPIRRSPAAAIACCGSTRPAWAPTSWKTAARAPRGWTGPPRPALVTARPSGSAAAPLGWPPVRSSRNPSR